MSLSSSQYVYAGTRPKTYPDIISIRSDEGLSKRSKRQLLLLLRRFKNLDQLSVDTPAFLPCERPLVSSNFVPCVTAT